MAYCNSCGTKMNSNEPFCSKCGMPNPMNNANTNNKNSTLSIFALVLSIIGCTSIIGFILAIVDLNKKDGKKKTCSIIAIVFSSINIIISLLFFSIVLNSDTDSSNNDTQIEVSQEEPQGDYKEIEDNQQKEITENLETEKPKEFENIEETKEPENQETEEIEEIEGEQVITKSDYTKDCIEYKYKTIARNPDDCIGNKYYGTFEVFSKENGSWYSGYDICYKCFDEENNFIYVIDMQDKDSEDYVNVLDGDTIVVYGTFNGMVESKNYLNNSVSDEVCLNMYFCDLIEE